MEADWEFEIGDGAPVIEARWSGFSDLLLRPNGAFQLPEAVQFVPLAHALIRLNAADSSVWTSKCDLFPSLPPGEFDADELDAPEESATHAIGCYIDLLPRSDQQWDPPFRAQAVCKALCARLHKIELRCCRVDLVIRTALIADDMNDLGITAYLTACGATPGDAAATLGTALVAFADAVAPAAPRHSH